MMAYQGYTGEMEWDDEAQIFHGNVANLRSVITFQGRTEAEARQAFRDSIDDYLAWAAEDGFAPEIPAGNELVLHLPPDLVRQAFLSAQKAGVTLDEWAIAALSRNVAPELAS